MPFSPANSLNKKLIKHLPREVDWDQLTPNMRHYAETKALNPEALLLYRMGDYYHCFFEDAIALARELELVVMDTVAGENIGKTSACFVPYHSLDRHVAQLVEKGYSVAICDQAPKASKKKGAKHRDFTRVINPETAIADEV